MAWDKNYRYLPIHIIAEGLEQKAAALPAELPCEDVLDQRAVQILDQAHALVKDHAPPPEKAGKAETASIAILTVLLKWRRVMKLLQNHSSPVAPLCHQVK